MNKRRQREWPDDRPGGDETEKRLGTALRCGAADSGPDKIAETLAYHHLRVDGDPEAICAALARGGPVISDASIRRVVDAFAAAGVLVSLLPAPWDD
jgi:hypothetical protein